MMLGQSRLAQRPRSGLALTAGAFITLPIGVGESQAFANPMETRFLLCPRGQFLPSVVAGGVHSMLRRRQHRHEITFPLQFQDFA